MKNKENRIFTLLSIAAMMFLSLATTQVQAQTFSGRAVGTQSTTTSQVGATTPVEIAVAANAAARLADTGELPPQGGSRTASVVNASVALGTAPVTGTLNTGLITASTSGSNGTSQSQARVEGLNLLVGGTLGTFRITANAITTNTNCVCGGPAGATATCTGNTDIANLLVQSSTGTVLASFDARVTAPNTTVFTTTASTDVGSGSTQVQTTTTITIIANEQTRTPDDGIPATDDITVNGLRVIVTETVTVGTVGNAVTTTTTSNTIIAQAKSDINCTATPLTDLQITKTCVNNANVITCTITVTNISGNAATNVIVTDNLSNDTTFASASTSGFTTLTTPIVGARGGTVTGTVATLASGASATITIVSNVAPGTPAGTQIANTATVATATTDAVVANNTASATVTVLAPTAASATISGRVLTSKGRGLPGATVVLTNQNGEVKYAVTNSRGYYRFADIEVGEDYFLSVKSKRYVFATQSISFIEELTDIDFMPTQ